MTKKVEINISGVVDSEEEQYIIEAEELEKLVEEARAAKKKQEGEERLKQLDIGFDTFVIEDDALVDSFEIIDED
jgi:hypothetical protein